MNIAVLNFCTFSPFIALQKMLNIVSLCRMLHHTRCTMSIHGLPWKIFKSTLINISTCVFRYVLKLPDFCVQTDFHSGSSFTQWNVDFGIWSYSSTSRNIERNPSLKLVLYHGTSEQLTAC